MKIRKSLVVAVVVLGALGGTAALAAYGRVARHRGPGGPEGLMGRLIDDKDVQERIKLSADQVERLRTIRDDARTRIRELRAQAIKTRAELRAAMLDTKASRQDLERSAAAVRESVSAVAQEVTRRLLDARDVLSVDQREELRSIIRERVGTRRRGPARRHRAERDGGASARPDDGSTDAPDYPEASPDPE